MVEHVELNLDDCGKHFLVLSFFLLQLASICTFCLNFYQFYIRSCNPAVYKLGRPLDLIGLDIDMDKVLMANVIASIVLKFGSAVCLRLALEEYQNLSSNTSYFVYSMMMTVAPTSLLAPIYTYDHVNCMSKNFIMPQSGAELISTYSLFLTAFPIVFFIILPSTWKRFFCCGRGYLKTHTEKQQ